MPQRHGANWISIHIYQDKFQVGEKVKCMNPYKYRINKSELFYNPGVRGNFLTADSMSRSHKGKKINEFYYK